MRIIQSVLVAFFVFLFTRMVRASETEDAALDKKLRETAVAPVRQPIVLDLPIGFLERPSSPGKPVWRILGTSWRVRLYPETRGLERLDKTKEYVVHGVALDQDYGVIDVWVYQIKKK